MNPGPAHLAFMDPQLKIQITFCHAHLELETERNKHDTTT